MFFKERKVVFRFEFGDGKGLAREGKKYMGMFCGERLLLFF